MGYFYMKSLNLVYGETKCLTPRALPPRRLITPHRRIKVLDRTLV